MTDWRFFGRENELAQVKDCIDKPHFQAGLILGGRGIGKTQLLVETRRRADNKPPVLIFELRDPGAEDQVAANRRLIQEIRCSLPQAISSSIPPLDEYGASEPEERFFGIVRHLLGLGVVVCLDEFHLARPMELEGGLKLLIDRSGPMRDNPPGKLIFMGSHQQMVLDMLRSTEPLFGRARRITGLRQWKANTVFEMAAEQGFLQRPGCLLTLWCAFGGMPRNWQQFAVNSPGNLADLNAWDHDDAWWMAFLDWHRAVLEDSPRERFDSKAFIELAEPAGDALLWLANDHPSGTVHSTFPADLRDLPGNALGEALDMLRDHLGMIEEYGQFLVREFPRYRIAGNSALFQIHVYPELFGRSGARRKMSDLHVGRDIGARALDRLKTLEGWHWGI